MALLIHIESEFMNESYIAKTQASATRYVKFIYRLHSFGQGLGLGGKPVLNNIKHGENRVRRLRYAVKIFNRKTHPQQMKVTITTIKND